MEEEEEVGAAAAAAAWWENRHLSPRVHLPSRKCPQILVSIWFVWWNAVWGCWWTCGMFCGINGVEILIISVTSLF